MMLVMKENKANSNKYIFTVVIPSYNLGKTLKRSVDSVLNQTLKGIQIIVVDDNSTDPFTNKLLDDLKESVELIRLNRNYGVATVRNTGLKYAKSPFVLFLDSDDFIQPTYLEKAKVIFELDSKVGVISPWIKYTGSAEGVWKPSGDFEITDILSYNHVPSGSCIRSSVFDEVGNFDLNMPGIEDWEFWIRVKASTEWKFYIIKEELFYYNVREDSFYHSLDNDRHKKYHQEILRKHQLLYGKYSLEVISNLYLSLIKRGNILKARSGELDILYREAISSKIQMDRLKSTIDFLQKEKNELFEKNDELCSDMQKYRKTFYYKIYDFRIAIKEGTYRPWSLHWLLQKILNIIPGLLIGSMMII